MLVEVERTGAGADADVGIEGPVGEIVLGLEAGFGKGGDFILGVAIFFEVVSDVSVVGELVVVVHGADMFSLERGAVFDAECVGGEVCGF